ncbi:MAG: trypsin-like peptidase domain-containing protein [Flavobacteriales bacterium]|nr:trypsin-like peptidase domain-containing protein [Flavobacteriales bacterium]
MKYVLIILGWVLNLSLFSQQKKEFFDEHWKPVDSTKAAYYRLITYDEKGNPQGVVRDFYITGEKQWEGRFSYIDKLGGGNDIEEGMCTWYYKNGKMSSRGFFVNGKIDGTYKTWFESGARSSEVQYKNGVLHGLYINWYESGVLRNFAVYNQGNLVGNTSLLCDEFNQSCTRTFTQNFSKPEASLYGEKTKIKKDRYSDFSIDWSQYLSYAMYGESDNNMWPQTKDKQAVSKMTNYGYLIKTGKADGFRLIHHPIDYSSSFDLDVSYFVGKGNLNSMHGFVWGYQDEKNYYYFRLSGHGSYVIGAMRNGKNELFHQASTLLYDSESDVGNYLGITHQDDSLEFFIGFASVYRMPCPELLGNTVGFVVGPESEVYFTSFSTVEKIDPPFVSPDLDVQSIRKKTWKGNGSGFFISTLGHIVTNYHVIDKAKEIEIDILRDGKQVSYQCEVLITDKTNDLAIIQVKDPSFIPFSEIPYSLKTSLAEVGTPVFALGYPLALSTLGTELKFTEGTVNSRTGKEGIISAYQVSAPVQPGNSGGPLFDYEGNVLGVINEKLFLADNVAFAIKSNYIINLIDLLPSVPDYPKSSRMKGMPPTEQVKLLRSFIPLIKVK